MKKTIAISVTCFLSLFSFSNDKEISSKITGVTVYPSNAQIERIADYSISKGEQRLVINDVSPYLDPNTLQVKVSGKALVLDAQFKTVYPQPVQSTTALPDKIVKAIALLSDSIDQVRTFIARYNMELEIWSTQKQMLLNNGTMKGQGKVNDSIPLLKAAMEYYSNKMTEIKKAEFEINQKLKGLNTTLTGMNQRLAEHQNYHQRTRPAEQNKTKYQIILTLLSEVATSGKVNVKYVVSGAGWIPSYDLIQTNGSDNLDLHFKAKVTQNTGVNWENVDLTLATNNPSHNKTKPVLYPWYINQQRVYQPYGNGRDRKVRENMPSLASADKAEDSEIAYNYESVANYTTRVEQLIFANYEIALKYTIPSNGEGHHVMIAKEELKTQYKHYVVPKMDLSTYLVAEVTGWGDLQLLSGQANIYFDGSFVGKTQINPYVMQDTLQLSLGQDPSVVIKRQLVNKNKKEKIIGDKKIQTVVYTISYKNNKNKNIELVIQDQIPLSQSDDYEVEVLKDDKAVLDESTGILTWHKKVKAYGSGEIEFEYQVKTAKENYLSMF